MPQVANVTTVKTNCRLSALVLQVYSVCSCRVRSGVGTLGHLVTAVTVPEFDNVVRPASNEGGGGGGQW